MYLSPKAAFKGPPFAQWQEFWDCLSKKDSVASDSPWQFGQGPDINRAGYDSEVLFHRHLSEPKLHRSQFKGH